MLVVHLILWATIAFVRSEKLMNSFDELSDFFDSNDFLDIQQGIRVSRAEDLDDIIDEKPFFKLHHYYNSTYRTGRIMNDIRSKEYSSSRYKACWEFLTAYNSKNPVIALVDFTKESRIGAANFIKALEQMHPNVKDINFQLMFFNTSGVSVILETTDNNRTRFYELLESNKLTPVSEIKRFHDKGSAAFFAFLNAAKLLSSQNALLMFTDRIIIDEDLSYYAGKFLSEKNLKAYVVWGGPYPTQFGEYALLKELCEHTNGKFIVNQDSTLSSYYKRVYHENAVYNDGVSLLSKRFDLVGLSNISIPVDTEVTAVHIVITPGITLGTLTGPKRKTSNLMDSGDVVRMGAGSFLDLNDDYYEIHINCRNLAAADFGVWNLTLTNGDSPFNVSVYVFTKLEASTFVYQKANQTDPDNSSSNIVQLDLIGKARVVQDIQFVHKNGTLITDNKEEPHMAIWRKENSSSNTSADPLAIKYPVKALPDDPFYAVVNGMDWKGYKFSRLSYINPKEYKNIFPKPPLAIEVGENSDIVISNTLSSRPQLFFEVTNQGSRVANLQFSVSDEKYMLLSLYPRRIILGPQETRSVTVTLSPRQGSFSNTVTFTAYGGEIVEKRVEIEVGRRLDYDVKEPELNWKYTSDCTDKLVKKCEDGTWTVEIRVKDVGVGLLQVTSNPKGVYFPDGYTTGTRDEITGYYSDSCCNSDLKIIAMDRAKNIAIREVNPYRKFIFLLPPFKRPLSYMFP
ncbi:unnamed protein product [Brassicogethes aeneus]|uniref:VWFA domain-containing protein n=1 Tax=Brassicogethes aeneus TaxID=1431903 RepID=A0A9P0BF82_BRAAE|nr:unnamed protein product [Brassicogethes aeneus]